MVFSETPVDLTNKTKPWSGAVAYYKMKTNQNISPFFDVTASSVYSVPPLAILQPEKSSNSFGTQYPMVPQWVQIEFKKALIYSTYYSLRVHFFIIFP